MQPMAARAGVDYEILQQFITDAPWDPEATLDKTILQMRQEVSGPEGVIVIDDSANAKEGVFSPGVAPQYSGLKGGVDNCQVAVSGLYALPLGPRNADVVSWPVGMRLYMPKSWAEDKERRKRAGIPDSVEFKEKPRLALELVDRVRRHRIPHRAVLTDIAYGDDGNFRAQLRAWNEPYVVGVTVSRFRLVPADTPVYPPGPGPRGGRPRTHPWIDDSVQLLSPKEITQNLPKPEWKTVRWGQGTKGPLEGEFARVRVRVVAKHRMPTDEMGWLLLERQKGERKAYICWGLDGLSLEELVSLAHTRWTVEQGYRDMKSELGWGHFEGRKWRGWHHHAVLTQIAIAYLALLRWESREGPGEPLPTLPEIRRRVICIMVEKLLEQARRDLGGTLPLGLEMLAEMVRKAG